MRGVSGTKAHGMQPIYIEQKRAVCNPYIEQNVKHVAHEAEVKQESSN